MTEAIVLMICQDSPPLLSLPKWPCPYWLLLLQYFLLLSPGHIHWWTGMAAHYLAALFLGACLTCRLYLQNWWLCEYTTTSLGPSPTLFLHSVGNAMASALSPPPLSPLLTIYRNTSLPHLLIFIWQCLLTSQVSIKKALFPGRLP